MLTSPFASVNPREGVGNFRPPTFLTFRRAGRDSGSELYPAEGEGGRLDKIGGER